MEACEHTPERFLLSTSNSRHIGLPTQKCGLRRWKRNSPHMASKLSVQKMTTLWHQCPQSSPPKLLRPATENPYDSLKEQLVRCTTVSGQRKLQQLSSRKTLVMASPHSFFVGCTSFSGTGLVPLMACSSMSSFCNIFLMMFEWCSLPLMILC